MEGKEGVAGMQEEMPKKRIPLESLSKEELIKRYKNLLVIAQKAKEAKDEANEEMKAMKEKLNALQENNASKSTQKIGNDLLKEKQINAMQEMVSNLTDQKLQFAMEMDAVKKKTTKLEEKLSQMKIKEGMLNNRIGDLETERDGFERQARRLEAEAESLTLALDQTERQGKEALLAVKAEAQKLQKELDCLMSKSDIPPDSSPSIDIKKQLAIEEEKYDSLQKEVTLLISLLKEGSQVENTKCDFNTLKFVWDFFTELKEAQAKEEDEIKRLKKIEEEKNIILEEIEKLKELADAGKLAQDQIRELSQYHIIYS